MNSVEAPSGRLQRRRAGIGRASWSRASTPRSPGRRRGRGTAVFVSGPAFTAASTCGPSPSAHRAARCRRGAFGMPRLDLFEALHGDLDPLAGAEGVADAAARRTRAAELPQRLLGDRAHSAPSDAGLTVEIGVRATLADGSARSSRARRARSPRPLGGRRPPVAPGGRARTARRDLHGDLRAAAGSLRAPDRLDAGADATRTGSASSATITARPSASRRSRSRSTATSASSSRAPSAGWASTATSSARWRMAPARGRLSRSADQDDRWYPDKLATLRRRHRRRAAGLQRRAARRRRRARSSPTPTGRGAATTTRTSPRC